MNKDLYETEEDTKLRYITPALEKAGWSLSQIMMEYNLQSDRQKIVPRKNRTEKKMTRTRVDYVLCHDINIPIAVVEAKSRSHQAEEGIDQAIKYAEMLDVNYAYACSGEYFVEFDRSTGIQTKIEMDRFPSPNELWARWIDARGVKKAQEGLIDKTSYYTTMDGKVPRYYQMVAINRVVNAVVVDQRKRALLVMATGTGKTYTAFQIVWRLRQAGVIKNVLYLADRNQLIDQSLIGDFAPFENIQTKISKGKIDTNYCIYFGLYHQLKGKNDDEEDEDGYNLADHFRQVPPDYFDFIIVDECHRGSAREDSSWREILNYYSSAIQLGLTATPNEQDGAVNSDYFGDPLYTYTLKQGIEDGFLAPYQIISVHFDKDLEGWEPEIGETDDNGKPLPQRKFSLSDFGKTIELKQRTKLVAKKITEFLHHIGRKSKTIIFCATERHALSMRDAMRACNHDMMAKDPNYVVRMTAGDLDGKSMYEAFCSVKEESPVIVTTSKLLTTGADTKCVKLIVLDSSIKSMTEFKQIIGRGTRLREDAGKTFFTIMDFRNVCDLFKDPDFDGNPDGDPYPWVNGDPPPFDPPEKPIVKTPKDPTGDTSHKREYYEVGDVSVEVIGQQVSYLNEDGSLVKDHIDAYTRKNIRSLYETEDEFVTVWNNSKNKKKILNELSDRGVFIEQLKKEMGNNDLDEFDMICSIAYGSTPITRTYRASKAKRSKFLSKYQGKCKDILETLIDVYAKTGISNIEDKAVLKGESFKNFGGPIKIVQEFGGKNAYEQALAELENAFYQIDNTADFDNNYRAMKK